jgi:hypothetical protein
MSPELSHRVAKIMNIPFIRKKGLDWRFAFANRIEKADIFDDLQRRDRKTILKAEKLISGEI